MSNFTNASTIVSHSTWYMVSTDATSLHYIRTYRSGASCGTVPLRESATSCGKWRDALLQVGDISKATSNCISHKGLDGSSEHWGFQEVTWSMHVDPVNNVLTIARKVIRGYTDPTNAVPLMVVAEERELTYRNWERAYWKVGHLMISRWRDRAISFDTIEEYANWWRSAIAGLPQNGAMCTQLCCLVNPDPARPDEYGKDINLTFMSSISQAEELFGLTGPPPTSYYVCTLTNFFLFPSAKE